MGYPLLMLKFGSIPYAQTDHTYWIIILRLYSKQIHVRLVERIDNRHKNIMCVRRVSWPSRLLLYLAWVNNWTGGMVIRQSFDKFLPKSGLVLGSFAWRHGCNVIWFILLLCLGAIWEWELRIRPLPRCHCHREHLDRENGKGGYPREVFKFWLPV